jgi:hypothetical protein
LIFKVANTLNVKTQQVIIMRECDVQQDGILSYLSRETRMPQDHPLRSIRKTVNKAWLELPGDFRAMHAREGHPSIPPEKLLRALVLQFLYSVRRNGWSGPQKSAHLVSIPVSLPPVVGFFSIITVCG